MSVCVIILNYFGHQDTVDCVKALIDKRSDKIIVVENSGDLNEENILRSSLVRLPSIEIVSSCSNLGFAGGVNFALKRMLPFGFDAFLILNNDTLPPADLIQKLVHGAEAQSLDLASPLIYRHPEQTVLWSRGNYYNVWTGLVTNKPIPVLPGNFFYLPGCCMYVRRQVFEAIGFFDESFFMYGEDVDFCHRAEGKGFRIGIVPEALIYHKTAAASVQNSLFYEFQVNRGHLLLTRKLFRSTPAQLSALCIKLPVLFLRAFLRTIRFQNGKALGAYAVALREHIVWLRR